MAQHNEFFQPRDYFKNADGQVISRFWNARQQRFLPDETLQLAPYIPSDDLIELVRLAQVIRRPILIRGEPGSGKTQLARSVAFEWYGAQYKDHYFEWHIKSTTRASDGIYTFDHIQRLRTVQLDPAYDAAKEDLNQYIQLGQFARAIKKSRPGKPAILLIDEIDKADVDFPNDLLLELDENRYKIPETGEEFKAEQPPLIFITSNDERELPQAFLRRCLFMWIDFPQTDTLKNIVQAHLPWLSENHGGFVDKALETFGIIRENLKSKQTESKNVATGELLNWLAGFEWAARAGDKDQQQLIDMLTDEKKNLRFYPALLKTYLSYQQRDKIAQAKT